jgi:hypothetical protein
MAGSSHAVGRTGTSGYDSVVGRRVTDSMKGPTGTDSMAVSSRVVAVLFVALIAWRNQVADPPGMPNSMAESTNHFAESSVRFPNSMAESFACEQTICKFGAKRGESMRGIASLGPRMRYRLNILTCLRF